MYITFVHRTFQEYFCALFVSWVSEEEIQSLFDQLVDRGTTDECVPMLCDLAPDKVTIGWARPFLTSVEGFLERAVVEKGIFGYVRDFYGAIRISNNGVLEFTAVSPLTEKLLLCAAILGDAEGEALLRRLSGETAAADLEKFFGWQQPFKNQSIEPVAEDEEWLASSWIGEHARKTLELVTRWLAMIVEIEDARKERHKLTFGRRTKEIPKSVTTEFVVRGQPQRVTDPRTGRTKVIPRDVITFRRVRHTD